MADFPQPRPAGPPTRSPARPRARRGAPLGVVIAGALLMSCAVLPWAGVEARSELIGGAIADDVRGVDAAAGVYTLVAGLAALACGFAGVLGRPRLAALAAVPGGAAVVVLVSFVTGDRSLRDRVSVDLGDLLSIEPVIRFGWFAALASAVAVILLAVVALVRRG
ncbi:hypothetical protein [Nonomuraea sp. B1E8]|uniref:hypothetical protein n=1 Tax=unclassified Nonomuraea TaxID=2593643 RepID=UPI00325E59EA